MSTFSNAIQRGSRGSQPAASAVITGTLYCVTDESNKLERSNGTTWDSYSATASGGDVIKGSIDVSAADLASINTSPKTLVAAQGANTIIVPLYWTVESNISVVFTNAPTWTIAYAVDKTNPILGALTLAINATGHRIITGSSNNPLNPTFNLATSDCRNSALIFRGNADVTGAGTGTLRIHFAYMVSTTI